MRLKHERTAAAASASVAKTAGLIIAGNPQDRKVHSKPKEVGFQSGASSSGASWRSQTRSCMMYSEASLLLSSSNLQVKCSPGMETCSRGLEHDKLFSSWNHTTLGQVNVDPKSHLLIIDMNCRKSSVFLIDSPLY